MSSSADVNATAYAQFLKSNVPPYPMTAGLSGCALPNPGDYPYPPSTVGNKEVPWKMTDRVGPYTPQVYPYGTRGWPVTYALGNGMSYERQKLVEQVIDYLDEYGPLEIKDLSKRFRISHPRMRHLMRELHKLGLVRKIISSRQRLWDLN